MRNPYPGRYSNPAYRGYVLILMFLVYVLTNLDRGIIGVLVEPMKRDLGLTDGQMGLLIGPAFAVSFIFAGLPMGRLADRSCRRNIVAVCVCAWSVMTAFCGLAQNFLQLLLSRAAVGVGEAGGPPAAISLISDVFPERTRTSAFSVFYAGAPIGMMVAFAGGAWVSANYGWQSAFIAAAIPGVVLALVVWLTVAEPVRGMSDRLVVSDQVPTRDEVAHFILGQHSLLHCMAGMALCLLVGAGAMAFLTSFFMRTHGLSQSSAGTAVSLAFGLGCLLGAIACGCAVDRLVQKDGRWRYRIPATSALLASGSFSGAMLMGSLPVVIALVFVWSFFTVCFAVPTYAAFQSLVEASMRATMGSIQFILSGVIGGLGPLVVGLASDSMALWAGMESLRYALLVLGTLYLWATAHFLFAGRTMKADLERVGIQPPAKFQT